MAYNEEIAFRVRKLLQKRNDITEKKMFGGHSFLLSGNMCCGVLNDDLVLRVDPKRHKYILEKRPYILEHKLYLDAKTKFQEAAQEKVGVTPTYQVLEEHGPDHNRYFKVGIYLGTDLIASGEGTSKQEAQVEAAENALRVKGW